MDRGSDDSDGTSSNSPSTAIADRVVKESGHSSQKPKAAKPTELVELAEQQRFRCALSGLELTPTTSDLDHKVPVNDGGTHAVENLQWVHRTINRMRGTLSVDEFIRLCRVVADFRGSL